ncbi:MAG: HlyD family secretion protein [bacterium]|jgi:multidrug resistance efflux pump
MPISVNEKSEIIEAVNNNLNLRSKGIDEIISKRPGFLERWVMLIFLVILILLFASTWFIHYPEVIKTRATLIATNAPKEIVTRQEGRLTKLFVKNNDTVTEGTILAFLESNAKHEQVILLSKFLDTTLAELQNNAAQNIILRFVNNFDSLGELQKAYQEFITAYQQFTDYLKDGYYLKKKKVLVEELLFLQANHDLIINQKELMLKDLKLTEETYLANSYLLKENVISKQEERNEQSKLFNKQLNIPLINTNLLNNEMQQRLKLKEIYELDHSISQQKIIFQQSAQTFQNLTNEWIRNYILKAPISGKVNFMIPIQENQYLKLGKSLGFINPPNSMYYAEVILPQNNFGKIDAGQEVQLRFDAYPYQEWGCVIGKLDYTSEFATDSGFLAHILLINGLKTNQHKFLHYRDGLKAEAFIITLDMRLFERFYYKTVSSFRR